MKKPTKFSAILLLSLSILGLTACGWQLRGTGGEPTIQRLHLDTNNPNSLFTQVLTRHLESSGIELVKNATDAEYSLNILEEKSTKRTATISASARVSERLLNEQVKYLVIRQEGTIVIEPSIASVERIFEYNEDNVLATDDEARLLQAEMYSDLARQISNRLLQLKTPSQSSDAPAP